MAGLFTLALKVYVISEAQLKELKVVIIGIDTLHKLALSSKAFSAK